MVSATVMNAHRELAWSKLPLSIRSVSVDMTGFSPNTISLAAAGFEVNNRQYMKPCKSASQTQVWIGHSPCPEDPDSQPLPLPASRPSAVAQ